jgi:tripartite ATP-independent transporter DctP family solute receptor
MDTKKICAILVFVAISALVMGCTQQETKPTPTQTPTSTPISTPTTGKIEKEYTFHLAFVIPNSSNQGIYAAKFAELVKKKSGGKIHIVVHPAGELGGSETAYIEAMQAGTLDMATIATAPVSQFSDALVVFDIPFLFAKQEDVIAYRDSNLAKQKFKELEQAGLKVLSVHTFAPRGLFTRVPVNNPEDINGLKLRTMKTKPHVDGFEALGAVVSTLPFGEVYTALQTGAVDGNNDDARNYIAVKFYEVAPYWYNIRFNYNPLVHLMSKKLFDSLPPEVQKILLESAKEAADWEIEYYNKLIEKTIKEDFPKHNVKYTECSDKDWRTLQKTVLLKILPEYKDKIGIESLKWIADRDSNVKEILKTLGYI